MNNESRKRYYDYCSTYTQKDFDNLHRITKMHALNPIWLMRRAGGITASVLGKVFHSNQHEVRNKTLLNDIMQYNNTIKNKYTSHGIENDPSQRNAMKR